MPLATVKKVLSEVGIECEEKTLDQMNGRLDIPCDENGVYYHHFISILSSRAELAKIEAINKLVPDDNSKEQNAKEYAKKLHLHLKNWIVLSNSTNVVKNIRQLLFK